MKDAMERSKNAWVMIRHTLNAAERIQDAVAWISDGKARAESEQALMARLASKVISRAEVEQFVSDYIAIPNDATKRAKSLREGQREDFKAILQDVQDLGNNAMSAAGISAYGLLQAVTRFEDWSAPVRSKSVGTRRAFRSFLGERELEKATAQDRIMELAQL